MRTVTWMGISAVSDHVTIRAGQRFRFRLLAVVALDPRRVGTRSISGTRTRSRATAGLDRSFSQLQPERRSTFEGGELRRRPLDGERGD